jgi:hypothetical protein
MRAFAVISIIRRQFSRALVGEPPTTMSHTVSTR